MAAAGTPAVQVLDPGPALDLVEGEGEARAIVWPGIGAEHRSLHRISLGPGAATREQRHLGEAVYYVIDGSADAVDPADGARQPLVAGSFVHVDAGTGYRLEAGAAGATLVGGPCPPDPALYEGIEGAS